MKGIRDILEEKQSNRYRGFTLKVVIDIKSCLRTKNGGLIDHANFKSSAQDVLVGILVVVGILTNDCNYNSGPQC